MSLPNAKEGMRLFFHTSSQKVFGCVFRGLCVLEEKADYWSQKTDVCSKASVY